MWQRLQALGELNAMVAAGVGGSIEWSLLRMRANSVVGMWQAMHLFPGLSALWCVCSVGCSTLSFMAGHARLVGLVLRLELVPATGSVAMQAIELARLDTGAHEPGGVGVVLSQVAAIRVIVGAFESHQTIMVEELVAWLESIRQHDRLGMTA